MTDYSTDTQVSRGEMARMLASNEEQLVHVLSEAITDVEIGFAIDVGCLSDDAQADLVVTNLRKIADAIESGNIS